MLVVNAEMQVTINNLRKTVGEVNGLLECHNTIVAGKNTTITEKEKRVEEAEKGIDPRKTKRFELTEQLTLEKIERDGAQWLLQAEETSLAELEKKVEELEREGIKLENRPSDSKPGCRLL